MEMASRLCHRQKITGLSPVPFPRPELSFHRQRREAVTSLSSRKTVQATKCWERLGRCGITRPWIPGKRALFNEIVAELCKVGFNQDYPDAAILFGPRVKINGLSLQRLSSMRRYGALLILKPKNTPGAPDLRARRTNHNRRDSIEPGFFLTLISLSGTTASPKWQDPRA